MASPPQLRVLERSHVSPPPGAVAESTLPLTFFDILWLNGGAVERVFLYPLACSTSYFLASILPGLKSSLSLALHHFYPLAGKIRRSPELGDDKYELHYVDGHSVSFAVAEYVGADFDEISGSDARDINLLLPLLPQLPKPDGDGAPVLALQVTVLPSQGVAVGVTVHHAACDGSSSMQFMSSWASTCARPGSPAAVVAAPPVFDRSLISDPRDLYSILYTGYAKDSELINLGAQPDTIIASFTLKRAHIQRLKALVSAKAKADAMDQGRGASFHCSTIVVAYAYVWACLVKARAYESDRIAHFIFAADCRGRLRPPLPAAYFGNCLAGCFVEAKSGELMGEDGVVAAARAIGRVIEDNRDDPLRGAEKWPEKLKSIAHQQLLSVAGSPKFRVYDMDFGWGRPTKVEITSIMRTGAFSVAESREEEGGVEIGLVLPKLEMDEFETHFSNDLKLLQLSSG